VPHTLEVVEDKTRLMETDAVAFVTAARDAITTRGRFVPVGGASKAAMLHRVLDGAVQPDLLPAHIVAPRDGRLCWLADAEAAALLETR
jgi:6-phosphogluconolactonase/glucosamine-6-phosphate isomerase/deaminase